MSRRRKKTKSHDIADDEEEPEFEVETIVDMRQGPRGTEVCAQNYILYQAQCPAVEACIRVFIYKLGHKAFVLVQAALERLRSLR